LASTSPARVGDALATIPIVGRREADLGAAISLSDRKTRDAEIGGSRGLAPPIKLFVERSVERDTRHHGENFKAICEAEVPAAV